MSGADAAATALEMFVSGLVLDPNTQVPVVILKDESGQVSLPIWIGPAEATSIASAIKQVSMGRPLTHDLMFDVLGDLSVTVQRIVITELKESTYFAELILSAGERVLTFDSRPSDAIALAIRASAPIYVVPKVLEQAKVIQPASETSESSSESTEAETPSDLKDVSKDKWKDILSNLDPDDFKYKM